MINDGSQVITSGWWVAVFPGIALTLTAICFSLVGDLLRSELDPRVRSLLGGRDMSEQPILTLEGLHVGYPDVQGGVGGRSKT